MWLKPRATNGTEEQWKNIKTCLLRQRVYYVFSPWVHYVAFGEFRICMTLFLLYTSFLDILAVCEGYVENETETVLWLFFSCHSWSAETGSECGALHLIVHWSDTFGTVQIYFLHKTVNWQCNAAATQAANYQTSTRSHWLAVLN